MRDFPVFDTENGVGSLILKQIPYWGAAYIRIHDATEPEAFLEECVDFCRMAGAKQIYATGHELLEQYPEYTQIWKMSILKEGLPDTEAALFPVTEKTAQQWQTVYNEKMKNVPGSAYMTNRDMQQLIREGGGYFVHKDGELLGLGKAGNNQIDAVISLKKDAGRIVVSALVQILTGDRVTLEVASTNEKALRLYESLGFMKTESISIWYRI